MVWRSVENSYSNWFRLRSKNVKYNIFNFSEMQSSCFKADILANVTINTTAVSISITSENIISWKVYFWIGYCMVKFWFCYPNYSSPIIAALVLLAKHFISSFFGSKLLILICRKCKPFLLSGCNIVELIFGDFWIGPGFSLTYPHNI